MSFLIVVNFVARSLSGANCAFNSSSKKLVEYLTGFKVQFARESVFSVVPCLVGGFNELGTACSDELPNVANRMNYRTLHNPRSFK